MCMARSDNDELLSAELFAETAETANIFTGSRTRSAALSRSRARTISAESVILYSIFSPRLSAAYKSIPMYAGMLGPREQSVTYCQSRRRGLTI